MAQSTEVRLLTEARFNTGQSGQDGRLSLLEGAAGFTAPPLGFQDGVVKALVDNTGSDTAKAIAAQFSKKSELVVNVKDYGAVGNGTVNDTASIQVAADAALASGKTLFIPAGTYRTEGTLNFKGPVDASNATINYYGTGTAIVVGDNSALAKVVQRKTFMLPMVANKSRGAVAWGPDTIGVDMVNLDTCDIRLPLVRDFAIGVRCYGYGGGFAYNRISPGQILDNRVGLKLTTASGGWASQNMVIAGRIEQNNTNGATTDDIGSTYIQVDAACNNNTFIGTSVENSSVIAGSSGYYRMIQASRYNYFINCRWETKPGETLRFLYKSTSTACVLDGGYGADSLVEVVEPGGNPGAIRDSVGGYYRQTNSSGMVIPDAANTVITGWPTAGLIKIAYDPATGNFTPRAGTWRIRARVGFLANSAGVRRASIFTPGGTGDLDEVPSAATTASMFVTATYKFDGTQTFNIQAYQNSGAPLNLAGASYNKIEAEYLGY